jgi:hypothetical protein
MLAARADSCEKELKRRSRGRGLIKKGYKYTLRKMKNEKLKIFFTYHFPGLLHSCWFRRFFETAFGVSQFAMTKVLSFNTTS